MSKPKASNCYIFIIWYYLCIKLFVLQAKCKQFCLQYQDHRTEHFYQKVFRSMILPLKWLYSVVSSHILTKIILHDFQSTKVLPESLGFHKGISKMSKHMICASCCLTFAGLGLPNYHKYSWNAIIENIKWLKIVGLEGSTNFLRWN